MGTEPSPEKPYAPLSPYTSIRQIRMRCSQRFDLKWQECETTAGTVAKIAKGIEPERTGMASTPHRFRRVQGHGMANECCARQTHFVNPNDALVDVDRAPTFTLTDLLRFGRRAYRNDAQTVRHSRMRRSERWVRCRRTRRSRLPAPPTRGLCRSASGCR
jgi:hypothetical protein